VITTGWRFPSSTLLIVAAPPVLIGLLLIADQFLHGKAGG
jgi:hypothetical protein